MCFIIFYKSASIELKIKRICDAFSANRYDLSNLNQSFELEKQEKDNLKEMLDVSTLFIRFLYAVALLLESMSLNYL